MAHAIETLENNIAKKKHIKVIMTAYIQYTYIHTHTYNTHTHTYTQSNNDYTHIERKFNFTNRYYFWQRKSKTNELPQTNKKKTETNSRYWHINLPRLHDCTLSQKKKSMVFHCMWMCVFFLCLSVSVCVYPCVFVCNPILRNFFSKDTNKMENTLFKNHNKK